MTDHLATRLTNFDAVLFDLDGVITPTADVHMRAWQTMFDALFAAWQISPPYTDDDYYAYIDGKKRYDGVSALLRSRNVELAWGHPDDPPEHDTVCGVGNRKNGAFLAVLEREGIAPYPGSLALVIELQAAGIPVAIVSSSKNARPVLEAAGIIHRFPVIVDGVTAETKHLPSKPAPDVFLEGARELGVDPARTVVVEDAIAGVESGVAGGFGLVIGVDRGAGADALRAAGAHLIVNDLSELLEGTE
ncbi:haloacid dehalogenase [Microbacterium sorbitolivorans]|uniref:Beta-phosphoglucomutase n=1 Tax=Microbacterium sorbitolivorans TaxID=1867410 RepID=A0A367XXV3_9MICO|nr:beta-phosphoglucomutase family hydrolase [Microbacterium sorbitolivorans]RCK58438.1 beta-phosphoglucomutase family hydrolase [Microbacterium sorbitolivorans]GGF36510.1 haloacid dehalogenase [Microbacterium sorbitolivorans]